MKKFLPYILIIVFVLIGLFSPTTKTRADDPMGTCTIRNVVPISPAHPDGLGPPATESTTQQQCLGYQNENTRTWWVQTGTGVGGAGTGTGSNVTPTQDQADAMNPYACAFYNPPGCVLWFMDTVFISTFGFFFYLVGQLINFLISLSLSSFLYESAFVVKAWAVVRDFANLFFIFILLYIAIKIILDLGEGEAKKMIAKVIISAMLINFSMFFTGVIIDTSNILGLIFYNKVGTLIMGPDGKARDYLPIGDPKEKDISGGLIGRFMPTNLVRVETIKQAEAFKLEGASVRISKGFAGTVILVSLLSAAAGLIIVGIIVFLLIAVAFLNRIAMLMFLTIFAPFAFMSFAFPRLAKLDYIGWDDWSNRLIKNAFFAPIFMFMLYFIFMLIDSGLVETILKDNSTTETSFLKTALSVIFGFNFIMLLLWFAIKYAYKASGKAGEILVKAGKAALVVGAAAATAGAGATVTSAVGGFASKKLSGAEGRALRDSAAAGNVGARTKLAFLEGAQKFNATEAIHDMTGGKMKSGLVSRFTKDTDLDTEGGIKGMHKRTIERETRRAEQNKVQEGEPLKQALNKTEEDLQGLLGEHAQSIELLDKSIEKKRQEVSDANIKLNATEKGTQEETDARDALKKANKELEDAKTNKTNLRTGKAYTYTDSTGATVTKTAGTTTFNIDILEKKQKEATQTINIENATRNRSYAEALLRHGGKAQKEASHKIIMETKLDSGTKT
jgi:hypothetical protein